MKTVEKIGRLRVHCHSSKYENWKRHSCHTFFCMSYPKSVLKDGQTDVQGTINSRVSTAPTKGREGISMIGLKLDIRNNHRPYSKLTAHPRVILRRVSIFRSQTWFNCGLIKYEIIFLIVRMHSPLTFHSYLKPATLLQVCEMYNEVQNLGLFYIDLDVTLLIFTRLCSRRVIMCLFMVYIRL